MNHKPLSKQHIKHLSQMIDNHYAQGTEICLCDVQRVLGDITDSVEASDKPQPLITITLQDIDSVPVVVYKGEDVSGDGKKPGHTDRGLRDVQFHYRTYGYSSEQLHNPTKINIEYCVRKDTNGTWDKIFIKHDGQQIDNPKTDNFDLL